MDVVRAHFRPEFLNRLDEMHPCSTGWARSTWRRSSICRWRAVQQLLKDRKIVIDLTEAARRWLGQVGWDAGLWREAAQARGAAPCAGPAGRTAAGGRSPSGSTVRIDEGDGALTFVVE